MDPSTLPVLIPALIVLALGAGAFGGFAAARAEHWDIIRRMVTIDGFLRANAARQGKIAQKDATPLPSLHSMGFNAMTEEEILQLAAARGMLHSQLKHRTGE
jgi:hypothetical protein